MQPHPEQALIKAIPGLMGVREASTADLAKALRITLDAKDPMHDSTDYLSPDRHTPVLRAAATLVAAGRRVLPRTS